MKKLLLHPLSLRIWHWTNAMIVILLIITGFQLRIPGVDVFPGHWFTVTFHKYLGYLLTASFLFWLADYIILGGLRGHYLLTASDIGRMPAQALYYLYGIFAGKKNPFHPSRQCKFNPLQKIAYSSLMFVFTPVIIITGILFSDILAFRPVINAMGGLRVLDAVHVIFGYFFVLYLIVHLYTATLGPTVFSHIKAMITGYEEDPDTSPEEPDKSTVAKAQR